MTALKLGELFAGYGGLGMGVRAAIPDVELAWYSDVCKFGKDGTVGHHDPHRGACAIMAHHHPDVPNLGDVTTVDWSQVEPVDILTGGSPCQDLSHAGKRAGMTEGTRSNLWVAMREAIAQLRPGLVVWENVRGAYSAAADSDVEPCEGCLGDGSGQPVLRALGRVLGDLSDLGYVGGWHGIRAADVGAPHGRFRVFVAASHRDPATNTPNLRHKWAGHSWDRRAGLEDGHLLPTPAVNDMGAGKTVADWDAWTDRMKAEHGNGNGHGKSLAIEAQRLLPTPTSQAAKHGGGDTDRGPGGPDDANLWIVAQRNLWGDYAPAIARWEQVLGRPAPAPTMTSAKGNPQLSPAFVEWLMGLRAGWVTDVPNITRNEALKALGNGVVPQQAEAAIRFLLPRMP